MSQKCMNRSLLADKSEAVVGLYFGSIFSGCPINPLLVCQGPSGKGDLMCNTEIQGRAKQH